MAANLDRDLALPSLWATGANIGLGACLWNSVTPIRFR